MEKGKVFNMKNKKIKNILKIFAFVFIIIVGMQIFCNVSAAINKNYGDQTESTDVDLDKKIKSSTLLDYIGAFIYAIGNIAESVTSGIMSLAGAGNIFPWADKVIFNTIPILDVNFINPDSNSLLATSSSTNIGIGEVVKNIYFSGISIALGFFGIIIAILAIKLAISTIGSDKAKYKEAMIKWITALVLLFGMHFALSFLFFLNENLVEVASLMLEDQTTKYAKDIQKKMQDLNDENSDKIIENFIESVWDDLVNGWNLKWSTMKKEVNNIRNGDSGFLNKLGSSLKITLGNADWANAVIYYDELKALENLCKNNSDIAYALLSSEDVRSELLGSIKGNDKGKGFWTKVGEELGDATAFSSLFGTDSTVGAIRSLNKIMNECISGKIYQNVRNVIDGKANLSDYTKNANNLTKILYSTVYNKEKYGVAGTNVSFSVITTLGEYFKKAAWYTDADNGGWAPNQVSIISAILYTMFVFQSISFFLAYIKRFFYVVILAVLAPFVVLYDFLGKSVSL